MDESLYEVKFATFGDKKLLSKLLMFFECNSENTITIMSNGEIVNIDMVDVSVEKLEV